MNEEQFRHTFSADSEPEAEAREAFEHWANCAPVTEVQLWGQAVLAALDKTEQELDEFAQRCVELQGEVIGAEGINEQLRTERDEAYTDGIRVGEAKAEQELASIKDKLNHVDEVLVNALTDRRDLTHSDMQELLGMIRWTKGQSD